MGGYKMVTTSFLYKGSWRHGQLFDSLVNIAVRVWKLVVNF